MVSVFGPRTAPKWSTTTCRLHTTVYSVYSYQQVVSLICKPRTRRTIAVCACYFQKLFNQLLDRDPYSEEHDVQGLRVSVHEVSYAHSLHVAQIIISPLLHTFIVLLAYFFQRLSLSSIFSVGAA
jgi:hypothetical protein